METVKRPAQHSPSPSKDRLSVAFAVVVAEAEEAEVAEGCEYEATPDFQTMRAALHSVISLAERKEVAMEARLLISMGRSYLGVGPLSYHSFSWVGGWRGRRKIIGPKTIGDNSCARFLKVVKIIIII